MKVRISRAHKVQYIFVHVTAGWTSGMKTNDYFLRSKENGGRGWNTGGYHRIIETNGNVFEAYDFERITNGVAGFNSDSIHIAVVGGVNRQAYEKGIYYAEDTRTAEQKVGIIECILEVFDWMKDNGRDITKKILILGHRDASLDQDDSGIIESDERIKECPCFDAIPEYILYSSTNDLPKLPRGAKVKFKKI